MSDDFVFGYRFFGPDVYSDLPIASVSDFIDSLKQIYITHNGRLVAHGLMLVFCAVLGKSAFNIVNTVVFGYTVYLTWKLISQTHDRQRQLLWLLLPVFVFYMAFAPAPGDTLLWVSGAVNYLWTTTFCLLIFFIFEQRQRFSSLSPILLCLIGLIGGQSHELLSISFSAAFLWSWVHNPKSVTLPFRVLIVSFWISSLSVVFAPGILNRAANSALNEGSLLVEIGQRIALFSALSIRSVILPVFFCWLPVFFILKGKNTFIDYVRKNQFLCIVLIVNLTFLFVMKTPFFRAYYMSAVIAFLLFARSFTQTGLFSQSRFKIVTTCFLLPFFFFYGWQALKCYQEISDYYRNLECKIIQSNNEAIIAVDELDTKGRFIPAAFIIDKSRYHFTNRYMSFYYGKSAIQFIPKSLSHTLEACKHDSVFLRKNQNFELLEKGDLYLIPVTDDQIAEEHDKVNYYKKVVSGPKQLPFHKRIFRSLLGVNTMEQETYFTIHINQTQYMVFSKKEHIKKIRVPFQQKGTPYFIEYPVNE